MGGDLKILSRLFDANSDGLLEVYNSLAYRVSVIERHNHGWERWFGAAATPSLPTHAADRVGNSTNPFRVDAGDQTWGSWLQILGSADTPEDAGMAYYDPHRIHVVAVERTSATYILQIGYGASGAAALAAGTYTEITYKPINASASEAVQDVSSHRVPSGALSWARCLCRGQNTGTLDFFLGIHEYEG